MIVRGIAAIGEQQALISRTAQLRDHRGERVAHIIADRSAPESQPAENGDRAIDRPVEHAARHLGHAGETAVKLDMRQILSGQGISRHRPLDRYRQAGRGIVALALKEILILMRRRAVADKDQPVFRQSAPSRFGKARHDKACTLIDRGIGDLELGIGKGDRAIARAGCDDGLGIDRLSQPSAFAGGGDFAHARPQCAAFGLTFAERLAIGGAARILVQRIDVDRQDQTVALGIAGAVAMRRIAQRVGCLGSFGAFHRRKLPCGAQRLAAGHRADRRFAAADAVGGFVQQADRAVAIGLDGLLAMRGRDIQRFGYQSIDRIQLRPGELRHHRQRLAIGQPAAPAIGIGAAQRLGHQGDRIQPIAGHFGPVVDLAHADDDGDAFGICGHFVCFALHIACACAICAHRCWGVAKR